MKRLSSTRLRIAPRPPIVISSSDCDTSYLFTRIAWPPCQRSGLGTELLRGPQHRLHDVLVARAAAEVAGKRPAHVFLGRVGVLVEERLGGHHHPRCAEPALEPVLLLEALLQRVQLAGCRQALD